MSGLRHVDVLGDVEDLLEETIVLATWRTQLDVSQRVGVRQGVVMDATPQGHEPPTKVDEPILGDSAGHEVGRLHEVYRVGLVHRCAEVLSERVQLTG